MTTTAPLDPDAGEGGPILGVLGGGQLGRMFVHAAQRLGYRTAVLDADPDSPAGLVSHHHLRADYEDEAGTAALADLCDAVTTEFENVPAATVERMASRTRVSPAADSLRICQHRAREKAYFQQVGIECAPFAEIRTEADLQAADDGLFPGLLKTASLGYDGKGQVAVASRADLPAAWAALGRSPCVLEQRLVLRRELSVIVARGESGQAVHLPVQQNLHRQGILAVTEVPAPDLPPTVAAKAVEAALALAGAMGYVGVLCVEFFLTEEGALVANEMAPRPHNSGHYSIDACDLSQFDLQVRALAGLPLIAPRLHSPAVMINLLGELWFTPGDGAEPRTPPWHDVLALPGVHLHLYGKAEPRRGRKMGHLTVTAADAADARRTAQKALQILRLPAY